MVGTTQGCARPGKTRQTVPPDFLRRAISPARRDGVQTNPPASVAGTRGAWGGLGPVIVSAAELLVQRTGLSAAAIDGARPAIFSGICVTDPVPAKARDGLAIARTIAGILVAVTYSIVAVMLTFRGASSIDAALAGGADDQSGAAPLRTTGVDGACVTVIAGEFSAANARAIPA